MNYRHISLLAMLVWPVGGALVTLRHIDQIWELILFFSAFTGSLFVLVMPKTMSLSMPGAILLYSAGMAVWLVVLIVPMLRSTLSSYPAWTVVGQSIFSFLQAAMGVLMEFGKGA